MSLGVLAALGSACAWAVGATLFRRIGERASPTAMNLVKSLLGLVLLGVAVVATGVSPLPPETLARLAGSGVLGIAVGDTLFFAALVRLDARTTLLLASAGHVFAVLLAVLVLGERPGPLAWLGIGLVITGVGWVLQAGAAKDASGIPDPAGRGLGILCGLGSALATSSGLLLAKTAMESDISALEATWVRLAAGAIVLALVSALRGELRSELGVLRLPGLVRDLAVAVAVVMFGGFWLSLVSLRYADASVATALAATEPVFGVALARWWLRERVPAGAVVAALVAVLGAALIVAGT